MSTPAFDFESAIRLFDETTGALSAQVRRLEEVLARKQAELVEANRRLTEQAEARERLAAWLNLVMGSIASGVVAVDTRGVVTTCNDAACGQLRGVLPDLIDSDYAATFPDSPLAQVLATGRPAGPQERSLRGGDGVRRILRSRASPLRSPEGELLGGVEVLDDVTELRELEARAQRDDRLKQLGEMAAGVAHEIRNPLNGIEGFASLLVRDLAGEDPRRRYAQLVIDGVRNLNRTVSGLLEYTKPRRIDRRALDPAAIAHEVIDLVRAEGAAIDLALASTWPGGATSLDGIQVRQVLLNLVQNACHAVLEAGVPAPRVVLAVEPAEGDDGTRAVRFLVDDNGPGVPEAERQRIFTPFYTTRDAGTGLGLAVAHTIIGLHGGSIVVTESPFGGARFSVVLPGA